MFRAQGGNPPSFAGFAALGLGSYICQRCGYSLCQQALTLHHIYPKRKRFYWTGGGGKTGAYARGCAGRSKREIDDELSECILLCNRCHVELESGYWDIAELIAPLIPKPQVTELN